METLLVDTGLDPLAKRAHRCGAALPAPVAGRTVDGGRLEVDDALPERLRRALGDLAPERRPPRILLAPAGDVDPFGPDPYLQSATFLTTAAALEAGVGVSVITRGVPARGFAPLFRRYPQMVTAHVGVTLPA